MNAQRAVVNLTAGGREWILAIVGKTRSMLDDGLGNDPDGNKWPKMGEQEMGLAPRMVELLRGLDRGNGQPLPHIIVNDFKTDERFIGHPILVAQPFVRSAVALPLQTPLDIVIGTYTIMDDKPRDAVSPDDLEWLSNMATTIMEHLDAERLRQMQVRSERMIKAMGLFVEGKSTIRDWWVNGGHRVMGPVGRSALSDSRTADEYANGLFGVQDPPGGYAVQGIQDILEKDSNGSIPPSPAISNSKRPLPHRVSTRSSASMTDSAGEPSEVSESYTGITTEDMQPPITPEMAIDQDPLDLPYPDKAQGKRLQEALLTSDLKNAFARASNLIREALILEGCVFFDASIGSFGGGTQTSQKPLSAFKLDGSSEAPSSSDEDQRARNVAVIGGNPFDSSSLGDLPHKEPEKGCNVLGFSTRTRSSINSHEPSEDLLSFPENLLSRFMKKYPHGKVMTFDDEGPLISSDSDHTEPRDVSMSSGLLDAATPITPGKREKRMSREAEYKAIQATFPGARSVVFFPLWDATKERWFAGTFLWSTMPARVLCPEEDITYIAAFGNTIMAEVARLSSLSVSQMKTDFISSISHELRSPLHGILGSVEFLQDTLLDSVQVDMIDTIHSCGRTLLDTINHVLDFSKINKKTQPHDYKTRKKKSGKESKDRNGQRKSDPPLEGAEDLCTITEEVVDSVYAGISLSRRYPQVQGRHKHDHILPDSSADPPNNPPVQVIMDIPWRANWNFQIDAGAWRRILMNIVNNALKYTDSGFIRVDLGVQDDLTSKSGDAESTVTLTVTDSGKGMSQEFLKHHLYTPFMQDDGLASGTGLGMSIVKQIIHDIGGTIAVTSEQGTGTEIRIALPLRASRSPRVPESLAMFTNLREKTKGRKACLVAFDLFPIVGETPTGILSPEEQAIIHLKSSMQSLFQEWFGMEIITSPDLNSSLEATVYVVAEPRLPRQGSVTERILAFCEQQQTPPRVTSAILVLGGSNPCRESNFSTRNGHHVAFLQQPYGPHKLGAALHEVFCEKATQPVIQLPIQHETDDLDISTHIPPELHLTPKKRAKSSCAVEFPYPQIAVTPPSEDDTIRIAAIADELSRELSQQSANEAILPANKHQIRKVLLVEDNEINLKLLVFHMNKLMLDHVTAVNGLEALQSYKDANGQFDVIFMGTSSLISLIQA